MGARSLLNQPKLKFNYILLVDELCFEGTCTAQPAGASFLQVDVESPKQTPGFTSLVLVRVYTNGTRAEVYGSSTNGLTSKQAVRAIPSTFLFGRVGRARGRLSPTAELVVWRLRLAAIRSRVVDVVSYRVAWRHGPILRAIALPSHVTREPTA